MRKLFLTAAVSAVAVFSLAGSAVAANPHYIGEPQSGLDGTSLTADFRIAGLGNNETITVTLSAQATAQYACFNKGGNHPQAANKETVTAPVSGSGDFTSGKNGNVRGSLSVDAPGPGGFSCPNGQRLELTFVSYTDVTLSSPAGTVGLDSQSAGAPV